MSQIQELRHIHRLHPGAGPAVTFFSTGGQNIDGPVQQGSGCPVETKEILNLLHSNVSESHESNIRNAKFVICTSTISPNLV